MDSNSNEKIKTKIIDALKGVKEEDRINFLINRLANSEQENERLKIDVETKKKENAKIPMLEKKISSVEKLLSKTELAKSKLEELCRAIKTQNEERLKKMEQAHSETIASLKVSLADIQKSVSAREDQKKAVADVDNLSGQLKELSSQYDKKLNDLRSLYEDREKGIHNINQSKDEEIGILKTELELMRVRVTEVFAENVNLKKELLEGEQKLKSTLESEISLRKLLNEYSDKYATLLNSLVQSNESFERVKKEMNKMNNNLIKVEAESRRWKTRLDEANALIINLTTTKIEFEKTLSLKDRQLLQLQELCRRLQKQTHAEENLLIPSHQPDTPESLPESSDVSINENEEEAKQQVTAETSFENLIAQEN